MTLLPQLSFILQQLPHEVEIGRDETSAGFEVVVGLVEGKALIVHEVSDAYGG